MSEQTQGDQLAASFSKVLNRHGYGFQYSALKLARDLAEKNKSAWEFEDSEFPVETRGNSSRIDFVLHRTRNLEGFDQSSIFMLAECKRVDPAVGSWYFVRSPFPPGVGWGDTDYGILEYVECGEGKDVNVLAKYAFSGREFYHLGFELQTNEKGDGVGRSEQAIEIAITQALERVRNFV